MQRGFRKFGYGIVAAASVLASPASLRADEASILLPPTSAWNADYAEDSCALRRTFGNGDQNAYLELRQFAPDTETQVIVSSDQQRLRTRRLGLTFVPDSEAILPTNVMQVEVGEFGKGFISTIVLLPAELREPVAASQYQQSLGYRGQWSDEERDAREAEITGLAVTHGFRRDFTLQTGPMHQPMEVMRHCLDELLNHWGIDVEAHRSLLRPVQPVEMERWSRRVTERYPRHLAKTGEQAVVRIRLNVSATGSPTDCAVQIPMSDTDFNELACSLLLEHARFEPAIDGNGDPIASYWLTSIIYIME